MGIADLLAFSIDLLRALWHEMRSRYYALALRHCGDTHPDAWLLTRRMLHSRSHVNDFFSRYTD